MDAGLNKPSDMMRGQSTFSIADDADGGNVAADGIPSPIPLDAGKAVGKAGEGPQAQPEEDSQADQGHADQGQGRRAERAGATNRARVKGFYSVEAVGIELPEGDATRAVEPADGAASERSAGPPDKIKVSAKADARLEQSGGDADPSSVVRPPASPGAVETVMPTPPAGNLSTHNLLRRIAFTFSG